jgi:hypothetical protein
MRTIPKLGHLVRDITTGFTGIAIQYVEMISGTVQLGVQPQLKEGETTTGTAEGIPAALSIDLAQLDYVGPGIADRVTPAGPETIALGNMVEDMASGLRGIAVSRSIFINGCVYYHVQPRQTPKQMEEGTFTDNAFLASQRLQFIDQGIAPKMAHTQTEPVSRRPGGPTTKAARPS